MASAKDSAPELLITDSRLNRSYAIPIHPGGYVEATAFAGVKDTSGEGLMLFDEGSRNTACIKSAVSHLNAATGELQYRQYPIQDLFGNYGFAENVHLLVFGSLPNADQKKTLDRTLAQSMLTYIDASKVIQSFARTAPMMTMIMGGLSACNALEPHFIPVHEDRDIYGDAESVDDHVIRTLAALAVVISAAYCHKQSLPLQKPRENFSFMDNMLFMMNFISKETGLPIPEQLRTIGSTTNIPATIQQVKNRKRRLYGFGHRIYRAVDPRATLLKQFLQDRAKEGVPMSPYMQVALELERIVETDTFFTSRKLKANTDLYTVLAYESIGIPEELVFPFICISRTVGFLAHWKEQMAKLTLPVQLLLLRRGDRNKFTSGHRYSGRPNFEFEDYTR
ncbi:citrate synthase [Penicillium chermesinum]|uniref:Citrate synthase n=1 Tax=Penicillium chermesinum TaxID=63820 RepID=A0A9W9PL93_9EURO|nr:citrate synthase [Penicillium chermesinum]KAJ5247768.1 citrate synthase [Penicillium chermesinum]